MKPWRIWVGGRESCETMKDVEESLWNLKDLGYSWGGRELWIHEGFGLLTPEVEESYETMKDLGYSWGGVSICLATIYVVNQILLEFFFAPSVQL